MTYGIPTICRFFRGWLQVQEIDTWEYWYNWRIAAKKAEKRNREIVLFEIPIVGNMADPDLVIEIERLIQKKYPCN